MALYYSLYKRKSANEKVNGKTYARAKVIQVDDVKTLAKRIEEKCTVHYADVVAVLAALSGEITDAVQNSHRVKLDGLGSFKLNISSSPADDADSFKTSMIKNAHIVFIPETTRSAGKVQTRTFVTGTTFKQWDADEADSETSKTGTTTDSSSTSGSGSQSGSDTGSGSGSDTGSGSGSSDSGSGSSGDSGAANL